MRFLLVLLLSGCAQTALKPCQPRTDFSVVVNVVHGDVGLACERVGAMPVTQGRIAGCSRMDGDKLTIWVQPPSYLEDEKRFAFIGHELWHGVCGNFHADWK